MDEVHVSVILQAVQMSTIISFTLVTEEEYGKFRQSR